MKNFLFLAFLSISISPLFAQNSNIENKFQKTGDALFNEKTGEFVINGIHVLTGKTYLTADTVTINGSIITHQHDLTIVARKVFFKPRPRGFVLGPFEIYEGLTKEDIDSTFKTTLQSKTTNKSFFKFPLTRTIPHISSVSGLVNEGVLKRELSIRPYPGKIKIIAAKIIGEPTIANMLDPYMKAPSQKFEGGLADRYSSVEVIYGEKLRYPEDTKIDMYDVAKTEPPEELAAEDDITGTFIRAPRYLIKKFYPNYELPKHEKKRSVIDPFFFNVLVGVDHYPAWMNGETRFTPNNVFRPLVKTYDEIQAAIKVALDFLSTRDHILLEEVEDKEIQLKYAQKNVDASLRKLVDLTNGVSKNVNAYAAKADPSYVKDIERIFVPDRLHEEALRQELAKINDEDRLGITPYENFWNDGFKSMPFADWLEIIAKE